MRVQQSKEEDLHFHGRWYRACEWRHILMGFASSSQHVRQHPRSLSTLRKIYPNHLLKLVATSLGGLGLNRSKGVLVNSQQKNIKSFKTGELAIISSIHTLRYSFVHWCTHFIMDLVDESLDDMLILLYD